jgi:3',5'-cyclic AMP phosphodiesterase CpdA
VRFAWVTDLHLDHAVAAERDRWVSQVASQRYEGLLISGDIAESSDVVGYLRHIAETLQLPVFFVLGNHDFYGSSIGATVQSVIYACRESPRLHYLTDLEAIPLQSFGRDRNTYLVGEDGWGDASEGDYEGSYVRLNDFAQIHDFRAADPSTWKGMLGKFGADSAERLSAKLEALPDDARQVLIVTHVPPFRDACWYEGHTTDDNWAPFFVCGQLGRAIRAISQARPQCQYTVLCGHTHHGGIARVEPNLTVHTAEAIYGRPQVAASVDITPERVALLYPTESI